MLEDRIRRSTGLINSEKAVEIPMTEEWKKFSVELTWGDDEKSDLVLQISSNAAGKVWLDRLSLVEVR